jgi:hypothetical protein
MIEMVKPGMNISIAVLLATKRMLRLQSVKQILSPRVIYLERNHLKVEIISEKD